MLAAQAGTVTVESSRDTDPFRASSRPDTVDPVSAVMEVSASTLPTKVVPVPSVAELPTCQNTLQAWAPPVSAIVVFEAVMSVVPAWKMNTAPGLPPPLRVTVPPTASPDVLE
jgi:hypothetical protein